MNISPSMVAAHFALAFIVLLTACARPPTPDEIRRGVTTDFVLIEQYLKQPPQKPGFPPTLSEYSSTASTLDWYSLAAGDCRRHYGYAVSEDGKLAVLISVGADGKANTADDLTYKMSIENDLERRDEQFAELTKHVYESWSCE